MGPAGLACAILSLALAAGPDDLAAKASLSAWKFIPLERKNSEGFWFPAHVNAKDFQDTRFQYRWKSERAIDTYSCTIEIRPTDDIGENDVIPELTIIHYSPSSLAPGHSQILITRDVSVAKSAHAIFKPSNCRSVDFVYWRK